MAVKSALTRAMEDTEADGGTPTPVSSTTASPAPSNTEEVESALCELIANERWSIALSFVKHHRGQLNGDNETVIDADDDIYVIMNVYCKKLVQEKPGNNKKIDT